MLAPERPPPKPIQLDSDYNYLLLILSTTDSFFARQFFISFSFFNLSVPHSRKPPPVDLYSIINVNFSYPQTDLESTFFSSNYKLIVFVIFQQITSTTFFTEFAKNSIICVRFLLPKMKKSRGKVPCYFSGPNY